MKKRYKLIALMLFCTSIQAGINEDLNKFFQQLDSGSGANVTQAAAWQGQAAGYLTGGSLFLRNPVRQIQLISVTLPEVKSGCGGIDAYLGSFSFINSDQIKVMAKQILSNAAGYAFDLALETALPQVKAVKDYLQKLATDINNTNISTCQAAQGIIGGLWPKNQANTQHICQDIAGNHSVFADWAASRQGCGVGDESNKVFNHANDEEKKRIPRNRNLTWSAFEKINQFISSDRELKELMMSLVGTVIYGNLGELAVLPGLGASDSVMDAILKGGTTEVYRCDDVTQCLKPTKSKITVTASNGMIAQIQKLLSSLFKKSTTDAALTDKETALIGSTRVQILRYVIDSASLSLDESIVTSLAEYIASDMVVSYIDGLIDLVEVAGAGSLNTEEENKQFQNSLKTVREKMAQRLTKMRINQSHLLELERNLHYLRQQLSSGLSDRLMSNYQFGGQMVLDTWFISGGDMVTQTLNAVASMVNRRTWGGLLYLAETLGILTCVMTYVKTHDLKGLFAWGFTFVCITALLLTPKVTVVVNDLTRPDKINRVDNVPVGLATPLWLLTGIGHSVATFYDNFSHLPDSVAYSKTGLMFGQKLMQESLAFHSHSPEINANFSEYVRNCVIPDIQLNHKYSLSQLLNTRDIYSLIFSKPSPLRGIYYQGWEAENTEGARSQFMTCQQATVKLKSLLNLDTTGTGSTLMFYARKLFPGRHDASLVLPHMLEGSYNYFMKASQSAADILKQNIMIAGLRKGFNAYAAAMNDPAGLNLITTEQSLAKMRLSHQASYHLASEMLPQLNTVLMLLCISLFPIMALALFVREITYKVIINYLNIMGSLMLWPVMFAIFNHIYNFMMATTLNGENVTFSNLDRLTQTGSTTAGIAGWMMMSIPFLSFKLFTSLGQQIASAGSYLGNALAGATTADASAVASGNYNMANMQVENINGFKTDLNRSYKAGLSSQQIDNGAMISTTQSGQHIVDTTQAISKLPFSLDTSSMLDTSFSKALSSQHQESESYHQGLKSAINDTYNISTALSNQFSKQGAQDSKLSSEQRQAIEDIQRQSQQAKEAMSSNNSTSREDRTSTDSTDVAGFGFGAKGSLSVSKGSSNAKASAELDANARYNHGWRDTNTDSASKSNRTSEDVLASKEFSSSQSATVIKNMTDDEISRISNSETRSLVRDLRASLNNTSEKFAGFTASQTKEQRISEQANLTETERLSASHRLEQEFTQFAYSRLGEAEASHVLTDAGSPAVRAQREALVSEFSDRIADDIRHNHFANQTVVVSHYQGMQVPHDASQYDPAGFNQSAAQLEKQADKGHIRQHQTIVNPETGESNKVSLLESAEANTGEYAKAIRAEKTDFGHQVAPTQEKIIANEKAINKEKSANLKRYEDKGGKSQ